MDFALRTDIVFTRVQREGATAFVRGRACDRVADALLERAGCEPAGKEGRDEVYRFALDDGHGILRPFRRGGFIRHFIYDAYFLHNRPLRELRVHTHCYRVGLSVPEPLGVMWTRRGPWYRGAIATREVQAVNLQEHIRQSGAAEEGCRRAGAAIRAMHDAGVIHADLQIRNILIGEGGAFLIDFDNAKVLSKAGSAARSRNLLRLKRSFAKNQVAMAYYERILEGYGPFDVPGWVD